MANPPDDPKLAEAVERLERAIKVPAAVYLNALIPDIRTLLDSWRQRGEKITRLGNQYGLMSDEHGKEQDEAIRLTAEGERLKAEVETLRLTELPQGWMAAPKADWDKLTAEVERLKAELADAIEWQVKMTDVAGANRERAEKAEAELAEAKETAANASAGANIRRAEIDHLRQRAEKAEAELAAANERAEGLAALLAEWVPQHSASCSMPDPGSGTFPVGPLKPNWCRCSSLEKRSREALRPPAPSEEPMSDVLGVPRENVSAVQAIKLLAEKAKP